MSTITSLRWKFGSKDRRDGKHRSRGNRQLFSKAIAEALESRVYLSLSPVVSGAPSVDEGTAYTLNLAAGASGGSTVDNWTINWGDGTTGSISGNPSSATHTFASGPNTYTITATATDQSNTYNANTDTVLVQPLLPIISLSGSAYGTVNEASPYTLNFSASYPSSEASREAISSWAINWGDGTSGSIYDEPTGGSVQHTYMTAGTFPITVIATDAEGIQVTNTLSSMVTSSLNVQVGPVISGLQAGYVNGSSTMSLFTLNSNGTLGTFTGGANFVNLPSGFIAQALGIQIPGGDNYDKTWVAAGSQGNAFALFFFNNSNAAVDGVVATTTFGSDDVNDSITSIAIQANDQIVAVGDIQNNTAVGLVRYNADGTPDTSFGTDGKVILSNFSGAAVPAVAVEGSGQIFVSGQSASTGNFILACYNANGTLDTAFGDAGIATVAFSGHSNNDANNVLLMPNGTQIIIAGSLDGGQNFGAARFTTDGILDTTFGNGGSYVVNVGYSSAYANTISSDSTGDLTIPTSTGVVCYNTSGTPMSGFGVNGTVLTGTSNFTANGVIMGTTPAGALALVSLNAGSFSAHINSVAPTISISGASAVNEGSSYTLDLHYSDVGEDPILNWTINWGDGTESTPDVHTVSGNPSSVTHTYASGPTTYNITASVTTTTGTYDVSFPDSTFGSDGTVTSNFPGQSLSLSGNSDGPFVLSNGQILVSGRSNNELALFLYNDNGTLDTGFGTNGEVLTSALSLIDAVLMQSDGDIVLGGQTSSGAMALLRLNSDGTEDSTFGTDGEVTTSIPDYSGRITSMVQQANGEIVAAGDITDSEGDPDQAALLRYTITGGLDTTFAGGSGYTIVADMVDNGDGTPFTPAVALQSNGQILISGADANEDMAVDRFNTDGSEDTTFGNDGQAISSADPNDDDVASNVLVQPNGQILIAGEGDNNDIFVMARFNTNGSLDTTFGSDGSVVNDGITINSNIANVVSLQSNGTIVIPQGTLTCYNADGTLDDNIGINDNGTLSPPAQGDAVMQPNGQIVVVNDSGSNLTLSRFNQGLEVKVNTAPTFSIFGATTVNAAANYILYLTATYSISDPYQGPVTWTINWGDGAISAPDLNTASGNSVSPTHTYATAGTYTISVVPQDAAAVYGTLTQAVTIQNTTAAPPLVISGAATVVANQTYTLDLYATDEDDWQYWLINWGDGTAAWPDLQEIAAGTPSVTHVYTTTGTYQITATATDGTISGSLDPSFGSGAGAVESSNSTGYGYPSIAQTGNNILVAASVGGDETVLTEYNSDGSVDGGFNPNGSGFVTANFVAGQNSLVVLSDGDILLGGASYNTSTSTSTIDIACYNPNGTLDTSFGTGGIASDSASSILDDFQGLFVQSTGEIVAATEEYTSAVQTIFIGFTSTGQLDTQNFGTDGVATLLVQHPFVADEVSMEPDNTLVAAIGTDGHYDYDTVIVRLNSNGKSLDSGYGSDGVASVVLPGNDGSQVIQAMTVQPNGEILIAYNLNDVPGSSIVEVEANGSELDPSFGDDGVLYDSFNSAYGVFTALAVQSDGDIVAASYDTPINAGADVAQGVQLIRYTADGALDPSFGLDGFAYLPLSLANYTPLALTIQPDGNIAAVAEDGADPQNPNSTDLALVRFVGGDTPGYVAGPLSVTVIPASDPTPTAVPNAPTNLTFTLNLTSDETILNWSENPTTNVTGYHVQWSPDGTSWETVATVTGPTNTTADIPGLPTQRGSYYRVDAYDAGGDSAYSAATLVYLPVLTSIQVTPNAWGLHEDSTLQLSAEAFDQYGNPLSSQPTITWSLASGSIGNVNSSSGVYTAPSAVGAATVIATAGSITASASIQVTAASSGITVVTPAAANPSPVTGTTVNLTVLGSLAGGSESSIIYTWSVTSGDAANVSFDSNNGTNAGQNETATFTAAGTYTFKATLTSGGSSATSSVTVTVVSTVASFAISPYVPVIQPSATQQFTATFTDQFGNSITPSQSVTWSVVSGGGTINSSGLYTGPSINTDATVQASIGSVSATQGIIVFYSGVQTTLDVQAYGQQTISTSFDTTLGEGYLITISGTVSINGDFTNPRGIADAAYVGFAPGGGGVNPLFPTSGLFLNGTAPALGPYNPNHIYYFYLIGNGQPLSFYFSDPADPYDNNGYLTVTVGSAIGFTVAESDQLGNAVFTTIPGNGPAPTLYVPENSSGNGVVTLTAPTGDTWTVTGANASPASGTLSTSSTNITLTPSGGNLDYAINVTQDGQTASANVDLYSTVITATPELTDLVSLSWSNIGDAAYYEVFRSTISNFTPSIYNIVADSLTSPSYEDDQVAAGTTYYYQVAAETNTGSFDLIGNASVATPPTNGVGNNPPAPTNVQVIGVNDLELLVSWTYPPNEATDFFIKISTDKQNWNYVGETPGDWSNFIVRGCGPSGQTFLDAGVSYYIEVQAVVTGGGFSNWTLANGPAAVVVPTFDNVILIVAGYSEKMNWLLQGVTVQGSTIQGTGIGMGQVWLDLIRNGYNVFLTSDPSDGGSVSPDGGDTTNVYFPDNTPIYSILNNDGSGQIYDELEFEMNLGMYDVGLIGYSHGGGMIANIAEDMYFDSNTPLLASVVYAATIDAVQYGTQPGGLYDFVPLKYSPAEDPNWNFGGFAVNYFEPSGFHGSGYVGLVHGISMPNALNIPITSNNHQQLGQNLSVLAGVEFELGQLWSLLSF